MGRNRSLASPEAYPVGWLQAIRNGSGLFLAEDLPWAPISAGKRFRLLLALLKSMPAHPLHGMALRRWHLAPSGRALEVWCDQPAMPRATAILIAGALVNSENQSK